MKEQAELNQAFFSKIWQAEPSFLEGMASQAKLFFPKAGAKTESNWAELWLGPNTNTYSNFFIESWQGILISKLSAESEIQILNLL